jgi:hypothetical protein
MTPNYCITRIIGDNTTIVVLPVGDNTLLVVLSPVAFDNNIIDISQITNGLINPQNIFSVNRRLCCPGDIFRACLYSYFKQPQLILVLSPVKLKYGVP